MTVNEGHSVQGAPKARTTIGVPRGLPSAPRLSPFPRLRILYYRIIDWYLEYYTIIYMYEYGTASTTVLVTGTCS